MKQMMCLMIISFAAFLSNSKVLAQTERSIVFNVTNIPTIVGRILISADKGGYYGTTDIKTSQMNIELKNIPNGKYKFYVFHDANNNFKLDMVDNLPSEYCATIDVEVVDSTKILTIPLINVKEQIEKNNNNKQLN